MPRVGAVRRGLGSARTARAGRSRSGRVQAGTSLAFRARTARAAAGLAAVALSCAACTPTGKAGGPPSPTPRPITTIVQLGDSFSSGNGAGTYEEDTCRRSPDNYSAPLARELGASYTDASCSGARTSDIAEQVSAVTPATSVVFLTAGGNDANFTQIISSCFVLRTPNSCEEAMNTATAALPAIEEATLGILRSIDTASHGQATAILVGYPRLFAEHSYLIPPVVESYDAGAALTQLQDAADAMQERVIVQMRKETGSDRFLFASTRALFAGHEPRAHTFRGSDDSDDSEETWLVSPFTSTDIRAWMHPTARGYREIHAYLRELLAQAGFAVPETTPVTP
ncbi:SGNH/GDSL hydrolase family protein [Actinotignum sp. GS-2025b]|uniref:SGNH/GDSL hydrolase family protein n=1 Tax=unclassified Actinotignum TaxID=2632702 RepID=UPI003F479018